VTIFNKKGDLKSNEDIFIASLKQINEELDRLLGEIESGVIAFPKKPAIVSLDKHDRPDFIAFRNLSFRDGEANHEYHENGAKVHLRGKLENTTQLSSMVLNLASIPRLGIAPRTEDGGINKHELPLVIDAYDICIDPFSCEYDHEDDSYTAVSPIAFDIWVYVHRS